MNLQLRVSAALLLLLAGAATTGCGWMYGSLSQCPTCGMQHCKGCKNTPEPGTAGYHCTTWTPLFDPCWQGEPPLPEDFPQENIQPPPPDGYSQPLPQVPPGPATGPAPGPASFLQQPLPEFAPRR